MVVIRNATPEYQDLSSILQQLHSLAYAFFGSTPRFSSNDGSPEGLMANKVRGIVGHGLRTPFPSGSPWDVSPVVRSFSASAPSSLLVLGEITDTGESAVATLNIRGQRTRLACAPLFCFSAHPAKTCPSLRRAILYVACTSLRPQTQGTASVFSVFSIVKVDDLPACLGSILSFLQLLPPTRFRGPFQACPLSVWIQGQMLSLSSPLCHSWYSSSYAENVGVRCRTKCNYCIECCLGLFWSSGLEFSGSLLLDLGFYQ